MALICLTLSNVVYAELEGVKAGPEVRNFDQLKRGDQVIMEYYSAFAIALEPKGSNLEERVSGVKATGEVYHLVEAKQKGARLALAAKGMTLKLK